MLNVNDILETEFVQRAYDGYYEKIVKIMDHENAYTFVDERGQKVTHTPTNWITTNVYPFLMQEV